MIALTASMCILNPAAEVNYTSFGAVRRPSCYILMEISLEEDIHITRFFQSVVYKKLIYFKRYKRDA